jgi:hypothetical protein
MADGAKEVRIRRTDAAQRFYGGRGRDIGYAPAKYEILVGGEKVGAILAEGGMGWGATLDWEVYGYDATGQLRPLKRIYKGGLKAAKAWALENFGKAAA